jgi:class 3 adenylate cyclase/tetratricopeptide (TPR) repeat protein
LAPSDLDHLRVYLPSELIEALHFDLAAPPPRLLTECIAHLTVLIDQVYAHLPRFLVERVLRAPHIGQPDGAFIDGALLFADISGFTAMSERLSRSGREGAEEITAIVNHYFDTMLSILRDYGGQLINFGGDALLGLFVEPNSAHSAARAALAMQAAMADVAEITTSQGTFPLRMKIGLQCGRFFAAQLGTTHSMEYALFGEAVNACAAAESAAQAGQIWCDRVTAEAISTPGCFTPQPDGYFVLESCAALPPAAPTVVRPLLTTFQVEVSLGGLRRLVTQLDALTPYLPTGLLARLASGLQAASFEGEHRLVAVLFANIQGLGRIVDRWGPGRESDIIAALNHYFVAMNEVIRRFGGVVNKIDLYTRGDKVLAFFGAPQAHEDDVERAVRAALAMQNALRQVNETLPGLTDRPELRLRQHIGLSYGYVFAGYVGAGWRREYTVMGDEVNLAARLMTAADPDQLYISAGVRRKVQPLFDVTPRGQVLLKGKRDPTPIFRVGGVRAIPESLRGLKGMSSPLVGRQTEWEQLQTVLAQLLAGRGQIVSVTGEAGLGKSRLVAELRQHLPASSGMLWLEGRCLSYTEAVSFLPFQQLLRQWAGIRADDNEQEAFHKLRLLLENVLLDDQAAAHLPYLATFLNLPLGETLHNRVRYLDAEALQLRTFVAVSALLETQARRAPLALVLEDIHWLDDASQQLIEFLMPLAGRVPIGLVLIYRPERSRSCWRLREKAARDLPHCSSEVDLHALSTAESLTLVHNLVQLERWPKDMQDLILERTEGNPLYVEEMIRVLVDDGVLQQDAAGHWRTSDRVEAGHLPDTLEGVMMARLDRLEEPCRWTAQVASIVGRIFNFDVLVHSVSENESHVNPCLFILQQHEIVREAQRAPELIYTFHHALMHEVCYNSLLARVRRVYHQRIAAYLEISQGVGDGHDALIAHHAYLGHDWPRALRYQIRVAQQEHRLFANQSAIEHLRQALESASHLPPNETAAQYLIVHALLGELLTTTGQYDEAQAHLSTARALAAEQTTVEAEARACRWLARSHELRGAYPAAFEWIDQGLRVLAGKETTEAAELCLIAGLIHTRQGHYDAAEEQDRHSLRIAQALGEMTVLARAYNLLGHITRLRGHSATAINHFTQAFELYQSAGDIHGQALAHNQIANACFDTGQWQAADGHYREARQAFSLLGDVYNQAIASNNLGGIALNQGRLDEAQQAYQTALTQMEQIGGSLWALGVLQMNLGAVCIRRGEADRARPHLRAGQDYFERGNMRDFLPELRRHQAEAEALAGDLDEARRLGEQALSLARELAMRGEEGASLRVLGEIATAQQRHTEAEAILSESIAIQAQLGDEYETARSRLSLAETWATQGKRGEAHDLLTQCLPVFERLQAALDLAAARRIGG